MATDEIAPTFGLKPVDDVDDNDGRIISATDEIAPTFGLEPVNVVCPSCKAQVTTVTRKQPNTYEQVSCLAGLLVCCPCIFVSLCCIAYRDTVHKCPECKAIIGMHEDFST